MTLSHLITLSISSLRNLDIEDNKLYDRAHFLLGVILIMLFDLILIDSEINNIKPYIKVQGPQAV